MNKNFFGILIAAALLSAVSCSRSDEGVADPAATGEEVAVTFSLATEGGLTSSRAISDGTGADMLVYAVYSKNEDGTFQLLEHYGAEISEADKAHITRDITPGPGQTVLYTENLLREKGGETITLRLMRGKTYYFAFWAQNHKCTAYDTADLEKVAVDYEAAANNDELRDAFCTSYSFTVQPNIEVEVVLTRALAQINVGTAGWDYNGEVNFGYSYLYSKIVMTDVYKYMNVLADKVITDASELEAGEELTTAVTYGWARIPAYLNLAQIPDNIQERQEEEELLRVKLTASENWLPYLEQKPTSDSTPVDGVYTEEFKYLSMCYVLVPSHENGMEDDFESGTYGTALGSVTFYLAENADGTLVGGQPGKQIFAIDNVPAQRNWRTNILGGSGADNSLFDPRSISLLVDIKPGYDNDHNTDHATGPWPRD